jgi:hypothetical protein
MQQCRLATHPWENRPVAMRTMKAVFGFEVDDAVESDLLRLQMDDAAAVVNDRLVLPSVACRLYDAHVASEGEHSCLGCNLNEAVHELGNFLLADIAPASQLTRFQLTLALVNTVWERVRDVCETLQVPPSLWLDNDEKFRSFKTARWWTNFMKHPGFFGLGIHHPIYVVEGGSGAAGADLVYGKRSRSGGREWVLIDTQSVKEHWSDDRAGTALRAHLREPFTACVVLPDVGALIPLLCDEFIEFVSRMEEPTWVELARRHVLAEMPCDWWEVDTESCPPSD